MIRQAAFSATGQFYKGSVHLHTTLSDGRLTPTEAVAFYAERGYDFVALTDHLVYARLDGHAPGAGLLVIPGVEAHGVDPASGPYDVVGLGGAMPPGERIASLDSLQGEVDRLRGQGMLVHFAHPYWSGQSGHDLAQIDGAIGLEVYNTSTELGCSKGYSTETWDQLLLAGRRLWGFAVDDAHWLPSRPPDAGFAWIMVKAQELTLPAILRAIELGQFYASQGPKILDLYVEEDQVVVSCSPASTISALGDRWFSSTARGTATPPALTQARFTLWRGQRYVRVVVVDGLGRHAWSNPLFLA